MSWFPVTVMITMLVIVGIFLGGYVRAFLEARAANIVLTATSKRQAE